MNRTRWAILALAGALVAAATAASSLASCAATPTNTPLRSFEGAKDIDVLCMKVFTTADDDGGAGFAITPPIPVDQQNCAPVPLNTVGAELPYHLFALVTQTLTPSGEVAVVDLTGGFIVDEDPATPGVNFLPVGNKPAGIATAPDGLMSFVTSADPVKPALYGLPSVRILGAGVTYDGGIATVFAGVGGAQIPALPSWPACSLPAVPGAILAVPVGKPPLARPADAGAPAPELPTSSYVLAVVLPGDGISQVARILTIDPAPLLRGAGIDVGPGPVVKQGSLDHCPIIGEVPLGSQFQPPASVGPPWDDGVRYVVDGGPALKSDGTPSKDVIRAGDEGPGKLPLPALIACAGGDAGVATPPDAATSPPSLPLGLPRATGVARAEEFLYVADGTLPLIHVIDLTNPKSPAEIAPLVVTSAAQPTRPLSISGLAISPPTSVLDPETSRYRRYLYAIDQTDNPRSIVVYDVTDPVKSAHVPLTRPHSELSPQLPIDRIAFTAPVAAVAFAQHDFPITTNPSNGQEIVGAAGSGLICNPNSNVDIDGGFTLLPDEAGIADASFIDPGAFYRYNFDIQQVGLGPTRLRGIFGFATLTNGDVMLIDIDDWDSPCRRPIQMNGFTSDIAPPEIATPPGQTPTASRVFPLDPYQVPEAGSANGISYVTNETYFPVSQPNRPRSQFPLDNDPVLGPHFPQLQVPPELFNLVTGSGLTAGADAGNPDLLPTATKLADPSDAGTGVTGVRLAWEDPLVHVNQNWRITYEGVLPTFGGIAPNIQLNTDDKSADDHYKTLEIFLRNGLFCRRGVEDLSVGQQRVAAAQEAGQEAGVTFPPDMDKWVGDYIQIADELLSPTDPYWALPGDTGADACWDPKVSDPHERYLECLDYFEPVSEQNITRDFPILEAHDDRLVISRFNYPTDPRVKVDGGATPVPPSTTNRWVTPPDASNQPFLKALKCCFHGQATFNVRTGGEWVATGSVSGLLHHVTIDPSGKTDRCVLACDPQESLLNARSLGFLPSAKNDAGEPDRDSPLSMRNPMFGYYVTHPLGPGPTLAPNDPAFQNAQNGCAKADSDGVPCAVQRVGRDLSWEFTVLDAFTNQFINLGTNGSEVSPKSMLFIPSLGQIAVVDGAQDGLIIVDLTAIAVSGTPFF